ncbi:hypothetical protein [Pseudonocardia sp. KRD291]|uniref:hypothetical protein n=1 Tax=Pseudonocardia sp. KRD291 TaxID=2792007 RepID=UPI001C4A0330|nr:hypothetical protein [Pseudonocardia sp. KRD291]MBW0105931.1 hypothetical protein [Pseudonocardia sp. KRD291]
MIRVLLKEWVVAGGECPVPSVGDVITVGLGLDVDSVDRDDRDDVAGAPDGIESTASPLLSRRSADVAITGRVDVVRSAASPFALVVSPADGLHVLLLGESAHCGSEPRVTARGTLVVEPHMWRSPGLIADDERFALTTARVRAVHPIGGQTAGLGGISVDVLLDLEPVHARR